MLALPPGQSGRFLESVVPSVFNYGADAREEFLLVRLFRIALQQEVRSVLLGLLAEVKAGLRGSGCQLFL